ncbi:MAG: tetratricopeptide repeat protein [Candidatus Sumerlaeota bacterium]
MLDRLKPFHWQLLLVMLGLLAYSRAPMGRYVYDDIHVIKENHHLDEWASLGALFSEDYGSTFGELSYRPLVSLSYFVDVKIFGRNPFWSRLFNVFLHLGVGLGLFTLWKRLFDDQLLAFFAAALFLVHPITTEVVLSPGFREELLAALATVGALILFTRAVREESVLHGCLGVLVWFFGLLSKETSMVALGLAPMLLLRFGPRKLRRPRGKLPKAILVTAVAVALALILFFIMYLSFRPDQEAGYVAWHAQRGAQGFATPDPGDSPWPGGKGPALGFLNFTGTLLTYARLWLVPHPLSINHWYQASREYTDIRLWVGLWLLVLALTLSAWGYYRGSTLGAGGLWALICLAPLSQIIPTPELLAERYLYFPHMGLALVLASLMLATKEARASFARDSRLLRHGLLSAILLLYITLALARTEDWRFNVALNIRAYEQWNNSYGDTILAEIFLHHGRNADAAAAARQAILRNPTYDEPYRVLGVLHLRAGRPEEALPLFEKALQLDPDDTRNRKAVQEARRNMENRDP